MRCSARGRSYPPGIVAQLGHVDEYFRRLTQLLADGETDVETLNAVGAEYDSINVAPPLTGPT